MESKEQTLDVIINDLKLEHPLCEVCGHKKTDNGLGVCNNFECPRGEEEQMI